MYLENSLNFLYIHYMTLKVLGGKSHAHWNMKLSKESCHFSTDMQSFIFHYEHCLASDYADPLLPLAVHFCPYSRRHPIYCKLDIKRINY